MNTIMGQETKTHNFNIRGISKTLKNRVKANANKTGIPVEAMLRGLIEKTYPPEKKK